MARHGSGHPDHSHPDPVLEQTTPNQHDARLVIWDSKKRCVDFAGFGGRLKSTVGRPVRVVNIDNFQVLNYIWNLLKSVSKGLVVRKPLAVDG